MDAPIGDPKPFAVLIPSRSRAHRLGPMLTVATATSSQTTRFLVGLDNDDPRIDEYRKWREYFAPTARVAWIIRDRDTLSGWTNTLARLTRGRYRFLMSMGDDHMPLTPDWDYQLGMAIMALGGTGIAYPTDPNGPNDPPTAFAVSYDIVHALGWFTHPEMSHWWIDNVWQDLGERTELGLMVPAAQIEHLNPRDGKAESDPTYVAAEATQLADHAAYMRWRGGQAARDAATIRRLAAA